jgi:succinate-semialdehyde dehydrogenase/glutarate-semialdehyde dehydrogenase
MEMIVAGKPSASSDGKRIQVHNPATGERVDSVPAATAADVAAAVQAAREGFLAWSRTPLHERARILTAFARLADSRRAELGALICREMGKTIREAEAEVGSIVNLFTGYSERARHLYGITMPRTAEAGVEDDLILTVREPLGVIACIIPFNYPVDLFSHKVAPALVMGNAVIVKPSSSNPLACIRLTEMLQECGVPGGAAQILTGSGGLIGELLAGSPGIQAVSFTGSTRVGIQIARRAAENMTRVFLECGGNDPFIVFGDADLDLAVEEMVAARASNAGQTCCASKRIIIEESVQEAFAGKLVARLSGLRTGNPAERQTELGCLISEEAARAVEEQVALTVRQGAVCRCGGRRKGSCFPPTVLTGVTPEMDIARDLEVFGPVFPIIGFRGEEEAVRIANNTQYGLQGGVMSADVYRALRVASRLQCGSVIVNGASQYRSVEMAFGGYKKSGIGREGISHTLEEMSQVKTIVLKRAFAPR